MTRLLTAIAVLGLLASAVAEAEESPHMPRIGLLAGAASPNSPGVPRSRWSPYYALVDGLKELGWIDGKNVILVHKYSEGKLDRIPALARELVEMKVDVIVAMGVPSLRPAAEATRSIPIVTVAGTADPVADGYATNVSRPGGNITGVTWAPSRELLGKIMEVLKQCVPDLSRMAILNDGRMSPVGWRAWNELGQRVGVQVEKFEVNDRSEIGSAMRGIKRAGAQAVYVGMAATTYSYRNDVTTLALAARVPTVGTARELPEAGGFLSYGPNTAVLFKRGAAYVDKILRGAKASDLPFEQPTHFTLVINNKTAKALGITVPASLLMQAEEVIQ